jgi:hypothetical protein
LRPDETRSRRALPLVRKVGTNDDRADREKSRNRRQRRRFERSLLQPPVERIEQVD